MILSAHQPAYLPWLGYFDKLFRANIFIFLDTVQYEKNSFINRNYIKTPQGPTMLTIPVFTKGHTSETLMDTRINNRINWRRKHLNSIFMNYKKALYFEENYPKLESLYNEQEDLLSDFCFKQLLFWVQELGFSGQTQIIRSNSLNINSTKSDLILDLCEYFKAHRYISGAMGRNYLEHNKFSKAGIEIEYQSYHYPRYVQLWGEFMPFLSVIDFWMNNKDYKSIIINANPGLKNKIQESDRQFSEDVHQ